MWSLLVRLPDSLHPYPRACPHVLCLHLTCWVTGRVWGWWYYPQATPSRSPDAILDSSYSARPESPSLPSSSLPVQEGSRHTGPRSPALLPHPLLCCLSSLPPTLAVASATLQARSRLSPLAGLWALGTRGLGTAASAGGAQGTSSGHRSELSALVRGFCFSTSEATVACDALCCCSATHAPWCLPLPAATWHF